MGIRQRIEEWIEEPNKKEDMTDTSNTTESTDTTTEAATGDQTQVSPVVPEVPSMVPGTTDQPVAPSTDDSGSVDPSQPDTTGSGAQTGDASSAADSDSADSGDSGNGIPANITITVCARVSGHTQVYSGPDVSYTNYDDGSVLVNVDENVSYLFLAGMLAWIKQDTSDTTTDTHVSADITAPQVAPTTVVNA